MIQSFIHLIILLFQKIKLSRIDFNFKRLGYPYEAYRFVDLNIDYFFYFFCLIVKIFTTNFFLIGNFYFIFSFQLFFFVSIFFFQRLNLNIYFSLLSSFAFAISSFHFQRYVHLNLINYFIVPATFFYAYKIFSDHTFFYLKQKSKIIEIFFFGLILSLSSVYYIFFSLLILGFFTAIQLFKKNFVLFFGFTLFSVFVLLLILLENYRNFYFIYENGFNYNATKRLIWETQLYGLQLSQMLIPHQDHYFNIARDLRNYFDLNNMYSNENVTSSLGLLGSFGFLLSLYYLFKFKKIEDDKIYFFSICSLLLFLFGTIGSFGHLFSLIVTPQFRGMNRVSIFILFSSIFVAIYLFQNTSYFFQNLMQKR